MMKRIHSIYQKLIASNEIKMSVVELRSLGHDIRKARLADPYKITQEIRVCRNEYRHCYGNLRILVGGAEEIIGSEQHKDTGEYYLLNPAQHGKFFKIDFSNPDVLVIGDKKALIGYANDLRFSKNIIFSENVPKDW